MSELEPGEAPTPTSTLPLPAWALPTITGVAGLILGGLIVGVGGSVTTALVAAGAGSAPSTVFASVLDDCDLKNDANSEIADEGHTLTVESRGEEDITGLGYGDLMCILDGLDTPRAVISHFEQTTSMDGRQTESWESLTLSWSYHPDRGADFIVTLDREK